MQAGSPDRVDRRLAAIRATGLGLALVLGVGAAHAGALIEFPSFDERVYPSRLLGYLSRPDGPGPFPAVVVLHGCPGFFAGYVEIADQLKSWGYVALAVDSLGSREIGPRCGDGFPAQATDAYAALKYLSQDASVDAARIAVLGYSMGGESALSTVERGRIDPPFPEKFAVAVVYYPWCRGRSAMVSAPVLILIGAEDNVASAASCREMVAQPHDGGAAIDLIVYPGAHHNFNFRVLTFPRGRVVGSNTTKRRRRMRKRRCAPSSPFISAGRPRTSRRQSDRG